MRTASIFLASKSDLPKTDGMRTGLQVWGWRLRTLILIARVRPPHLFLKTFQPVRCLFLLTRIPRWRTVLCTVCCEWLSPCGRVSTFPIPLSFSTARNEWGFPSQVGVVGGRWTGQLELEQRSGLKEFLQASKEHHRPGRSVHCWHMDILVEERVWWCVCQS